LEGVLFLPVNYSLSRNLENWDHAFESRWKHWCIPAFFFFFLRFSMSVETLRWVNSRSNVYRFRVSELILNGNRSKRIISAQHNHIHDTGKTSRKQILISKSRSSVLWRHVVLW